MHLPLSDVRIISLEQYAAGPYGTLHLADLGADIIKIESPPDGDIGRYVPPYRSARDSLFFHSFNRNKRSVCVDVRTEGGRQVLHDLAAASDGVFSNLRGDVPAKLGLRYADLRAQNPRIVCCSLSGYGLSGPRAAQPGFDYMIQGWAGWMSLTGEPDGPPGKSGLSVVDFSAGLVAALSMMIGLHTARRDGVGGDCDVSLFDTAISMLNYLATWQLTAGHKAGRTPWSGHPSIVPFGNFPTADGWIVAGGSKEKFWRRLAAALGLDDLVDDPRFHTADDRLAHRDELVTLVAAEFRTRSTADWLTRLDEFGVPCAPVNDLEQALTDPQTIARELVWRYEHPEFGSVGQVASPVRFGGAPRRAGPPAIGEHTREVLESLGYGARRIGQLRDAGVIYGLGV